MMQRCSERRAFTLVEVLVALGILGGVATAATIAVNPQKNLVIAYNAKRLADANHLLKAANSYHWDKKEPVAGGQVPTGAANAKPICLSTLSNDACTAAAGVSLNELLDVYLSQLPIDPAEPCQQKWTGYTVYQDAGGRMQFASPHMEKLPTSAPCSS